MKEKSGGKRSIDPGDYLGGLIEAIDLILRKRHILLSTKAQVSLYLGIYTFAILFFVAEIPITKFSIYSVSYGLLFYFILRFVVEVILTIPERNLEKIKLGTMTHLQISSTIRKYATKKPEMVIESVDELIKEGTFEDDSVQMALLEKYWKYPINLKKYVDELLMSFDFPLIAIKELIKNPLSEYELKNLVKKYGSDNYEHKNAFLFLLGGHQKYNFPENKIKYYNAGFNYKKKAFWVSVGIFVFVLLASAGVIYTGFYGVYSLVILFDVLGFIYAIIGLIIIGSLIFVVESIQYRALKSRVKESLEDEGITLKNKNDLNMFVSKVTKFSYDPVF